MLANRMDWKEFLAAVLGCSALFTMLGVWIQSKYKRKTDIDTTEVTSFDTLSTRMSEFTATIQADNATMKLENKELIKRMKECEERCRKCETDHLDTRLKFKAQQAEIDALKAANAGN